MRPFSRAGIAPPTTATHYLDRRCATYSPAQRPPSSATLPLTNPNAARVTTTQGTAPVTWRCTRYVALHPFRTGALPTYRVHCLHIGCIAYVSGARHPPSRISHAIPPAASLHTPQKPWNSNDLMSHSETPTRELHATYGNAGHLRVSGRTHAQSRHRPIRQRPHTTNNQATPTHRRPAHRHTNKQPPQP